jgi:hypothetical protein
VLRKFRIFKPSGRLVACLGLPWLLLAALRGTVLTTYEHAGTAQRDAISALVKNLYG